MGVALQRAESKMDIIKEMPSNLEEGAKGFSQNAVRTEPGQQPWRTASPDFRDGHQAPETSSPPPLPRHSVPLPKLRDISKDPGFCSPTFYPGGCFLMGGEGPGDSTGTLEAMSAFAWVLGLIRLPMSRFPPEGVRLCLFGRWW